MTVHELLDLLPSNLLSDLSAETQVDHQVKKLTGATMFKLILFSMLHSDKLSLRVMESFLQSARFQAFAGEGEKTAKFNSIRDRICTINADYFEKLFEAIFLIYNKELKEQKALVKCDSTHVMLAAKLFSTGMKGGSNETRSVKYSVIVKGSLPAKFKVYTDDSYASEDLALGELLKEAEHIEEDVVVFDRGLQKRQTYDKFTDKQQVFVTRSKVNCRCEVKTSQQIAPQPEGSSVTLQSDEQGYLWGKQNKKTKHLYRIIKGVIDSTGESICFITNELEVDAYQIAAWYKQRWGIEVFFKFIKQHLNVKHLVNRTENGIKVMLLMTMILAILIMAYKKINQIKGYKIAKLKFSIELENEIIKEIVLLCGGNPQKAAHLLR